LEIAPTEVGQTMLALGAHGGSLHKKYKVYLDRVGVAKVPENYEDRVTEIFPKVFKHLRLLALDPYELGVIETGTQPTTGSRRRKAFGEDDSLRSCDMKERYQTELRLQLGNPEREDLTLRLWIEAIEEERNA
jgi:hypothetical protein